MKANKSKSLATRRFHASLVVFLVALGLIPVSLTTNGASANTEKTAEQTAKTVDTPKIDDNLKINGIFKIDDAFKFAFDEEEEIIGVEETSEIEATSEVEESGPNIEVEAPVVSNEPVIEEAVATVEVQPTYETVVYEIPVYDATVETPVYEAPVVYDRIEIAGNTVPIFYSDNTLIDAGDQAGLYGEHFIYGHNTANVFGGLSGMGIGSYFTVTLNGVTKTYQVVNFDVQTKSHFEGDVIRRTQLTGVTVLTKMKMMKAITAYGEYNGGRYDYILMTCAGTSYGNGDASHRLIMMANEV